MRRTCPFLGGEAVVYLKPSPKNLRELESDDS
jgi:hypothetical protein